MSNQSVIKHNPSFKFKKADLVKVKLKMIIPKAAELCAVFDVRGIELLLYVTEDFQIAVEAIEINVNNYNNIKKYFKKGLGHGPAEKFRKLIQKTLYVNTVLENIITVHAFEKLLKAFIKLYYTSTDPKGDVIKYLKSDKCKKPKDKSISDYQDRMEEIMRYSTCLEGVRDNLSEDEVKTILFTSFLVA